ncbi:DUF3429 domain-containing protein [uncultured Sphingomonas sp.]|uniref:DUF3429 domain-containing protein n=1 Tax=uncultured Sphingomonas sp. TaxID=158754 RepID=UPI0035CA4768
MNRHFRDIPAAARWLGFAGLIPQAAVVATLLTGNVAARFTALATGFAYAALILSFLGGTWWGLAAQAGERAHKWIWTVSVAPSLLALASTVPWTTGDPWPGPSLLLLGLSLIGALLVDYRLYRLGIAPGWWLWLRAPLSGGLALLTIAAALL